MKKQNRIKTTVRAGGQKIIDGTRGLNPLSESSLPEGITIPDNVEGMGYKEIIDLIPHVNDIETLQLWYLQTESKTAERALNKRMNELNKS